MGTIMTSRLSAAMPLPRERLGALRDPKVDAKELRALRDSFGLTQAAMAQLLDVASSTYYKWEAGKVAAPLMALELMRCWAREEAQGKRSTKPSKRK